jgi:hypothetical protein
VQAEHTFDERNDEMSLDNEHSMNQNLKDYKTELKTEVIRLATEEVVFASETEEVLWNKVKHLSSAYNKLSEVQEHLDAASW